MSVDLHQKLLNQAGILLRRRAHSRGELAAKLSKLASSQEVEAVLDYLQAQNLLNDVEYAYNFAISQLRRKGYGTIKVRQELLRRQVPSDLIEIALDRVLQETGDKSILKNYLARYFQRKGLPSDFKGIHRLVWHLRRRGFPNDTIYATLRQMIAASAWQHFEDGE